MRISEYIERLEEVQSKYSDIDVKIDNDILNIQVAQSKNKKELYGKVDGLIQYVTARLTIDTESADWLFVKDRIVEKIKEIWEIDKKEKEDGVFKFIPYERCEEKVCETIKCYNEILVDGDLPEQEDIIKSWINRLLKVYEKHGNILIEIKNNMILKRCTTPDGGHFESLE